MSENENENATIASRLVDSLFFFFFLICDGAWIHQIHENVHTQYRNVAYRKKYQIEFSSWPKKNKKYNKITHSMFMNHLQMIWSRIAFRSFLLFFFLSLCFRLWLRFIAKSLYFCCKLILNLHVRIKFTHSATELDIVSSSYSHNSHSNWVPVNALMNW